MAGAEHLSPTHSITDLKREIEAVDRAIERADENENTIERTYALEILLEQRCWLMSELAALSNQSDEQT